MARTGRTQLYGQHLLFGEYLLKLISLFLDRDEEILKYLLKLPRNRQIKTGT